jgi:asparagine synthase (glutamine-hydrolysing)
MCGIVGIVNKKGQPVDQEVLGRMSDSILHRGPDEEGMYLNGNVGLAMRRLAIIDLKGGQQPIHNEDKTAFIVFNGEIYNYTELKKQLTELGHQFYTNSDTEAIIHAYEEFGTDCPKYLRGMFAFAIWDKRTESLFIARDRVGKKPLLYSLLGNQFVFASEFSAILLHPSVSRDIDPVAIDQYLGLMYVPSPLTVYKSIKKLEPGHWLLLDKDGTLKTKRYWFPEFTSKIKVDENQAGERLLELLEDAVKVRLMSEVPLGAFLSGGIDSSAVVALMSKQSSHPVKTFSIGFEEQDFSELHHARNVARHLGTEHHEFVVRPDALEVLPRLIEHYGEPYADSSAIPTYYVSRETRNHVTVALNGDGGDECFAGYERYIGMSLADKLKYIPRPLLSSLSQGLMKILPSNSRYRSRVTSLKRFLSAAELTDEERYFKWIAVIDNEQKEQLYTDTFRREIRSESDLIGLTPWFNHAKREGLGIVDTVLLADTMTYLPNDLLVKVDIASMSVSLEARSPFLDHKMIEFAASLPSSLKLKGLTSKYLLKRVLKGMLPDEILHRRKMGFGVPIAHWLRSDMKAFVKDVLLSEKSFKRGIFKPEIISHIVKEHLAGNKDYSKQLWAMLMLELWYTKFIDSHSI